MCVGGGEGVRGTPSQVGGVPSPGLDDGRGELPHLRSGGYLISGLGWGVPCPGLDGGGYPIPGGYPSQVWMVEGYPG